MLKKLSESQNNDIGEAKYYLEIAKISCKEQLDNYSKAILNKFDLPVEEVNKLDDFFKNSYITVIKNLIEHYKASIDGKRKGNHLDFNINIPVATTSKLLSSNQIEYLTMKYCEIFEELSLYELGINSAKISKRYWPSNRLTDEIKYDENKYNFSYILSISCSIKKLFHNKPKSLFLKRKDN